MSPKGAATSCRVRTDSAHHRALEAKPPGRRTAHSRPDSRRVSSSARIATRVVPKGLVTTPSVESRTTRRTPCAAASAMRSAGLAPAACRSPESRRNSDFAPVSAGPSAAGSARSATTWRTPSGTAAGCRETAVTRSPASASARVNGRPMFPVAPVTTIMSNSSGSCGDVVCAPDARSAGLLFVRAYLEVSSWHGGRRAGQTGRGGQAL